MVIEVGILISQIIVNQKNIVCGFIKNDPFS
jgi:hypothetical protein